MQGRIFSQVARGQRIGKRVFLSVAVATCILNATYCLNARGQDQPFHTDPATGYVYRKVMKTVERPVVETTIQTKQETVLRPQTVTETKPHTRTVYTPVTQFYWEPRLEGRWNPFRQPTVAYRHVPRTHWEARSEVVNQTTRRTEWVAEHRTREVPTRLTRIERKQEVDYELVGRVAPRQQAAPSSNAEAIASRLRPLDENTRVQPMGRATPSTSIAQTTIGGVGRLASDPPRRAPGQASIPATELYPAAPAGYGQPLPTPSAGIATLPASPFWR